MRPEKMSAIFVMIFVTPTCVKIVNSQQVVELRLEGTDAERSMLSSLKDKMIECEKKFLCLYDPTDDTLKYVDMSRRCDGFPYDCSNNADEQGCVDLFTGKVVCPNKKTFANVCDGVAQCPGGEDEKGCTKRCPADQMTCSDKKTCAVVCDGVPQCPNGRDEEECAMDCPFDYVQCNNKKKCAKKCDGVPECPDREDESSCPAQCLCTPAQYICMSDGKCIDRMLICNGMDDCIGGDDELNCPL